MANLILIGGGARSGKSRFAVHLAESLEGSRVFVATAEALDDEMQVRITRHQTERAERFRTVECPLLLAETVANEANADVLLIDCLTLWLTNLLEAGHSNDAILQQIDALVAAALATKATVIVVSNEVGLGLVSLHELGRRFQDLTGWAHQRLAAASSQIYFAALGCVIQLKPAPLTLVAPNP